MSDRVYPFASLFAEPTRNGLTRPKSVRGSGVKMVNMGEIFAHSRLNNVAMERAPLSRAERSLFLLQDGDLLFARQSLVLSRAGKCSIFLRDDEPATFESHVIRVRLNVAKASPLYYYYFQSQEGRSAIQSIVEQGAGASGIRGTDLAAIEVRCPPIAIQESIANILATLDDKIELNHRMNATLEEMARALFTSWFVDFDPVRAKMEGGDTGLPKEITDMFPDRLVESALGETPLGWDIASLAQHFEAVKGVSYKGSGLGRGGIPLHNLNSVHEGGGYKYEGIKFYSGDYADRHVVHPGDVIVANTEQGHDRLLIGYAAMVPSFFGDHGICSHHVYRIRARPDGKLSTHFLQLLLNSSMMHDVVSGYANGTTVNMLAIDAMQKPILSVPPRGLIDTFDTLVLEMEHRREQIVRESRTLGVIRDGLLPKLVSGAVRIDAADAPRSCPSPSIALVGLGS